MLYMLLVHVSIYVQCMSGMSADRQINNITAFIQLAVNSQYPTTKPPLLIKYIILK